MQSNVIKTISGFFENKFKEKGSLFHGQAFPVSTAEEAENILSDVKKKYYDATHNCYAYLLVDGNSRYSDDGEPNGTAGIRLLNAIEHFGLKNVLLISTRYFGGTKLGVGPLGKAYYKSGYETLNGAKIIKMKEFEKLRLTFDVSHISKIHHSIEKFNGIVLDSNFDNKYIQDCLIETEIVEKLNEDLVELLQGNIGIEVLENKILRKI